MIDDVGRVPARRGCQPPGEARPRTWNGCGAHHALATLNEVIAGGKVSWVAKVRCQHYVTTKPLVRFSTAVFHAGHDDNKNIRASSTSHMLAAYNARLRDYVTANHYMDTLAFHAISGRDMIQKFGYRECPKK